MTIRRIIVIILLFHICAGSVGVSLAFLAGRDCTSHINVDILVVLVLLRWDHEWLKDSLWLIRAMFGLHSLSQHILDILRLGLVTQVSIGLVKTIKLLFLEPFSCGCIFFIIVRLTGEPICRVLCLSVVLICSLVSAVFHLIAEIGCVQSGIFLVS